MPSTSPDALAPIEPLVSLSDATLHAWRDALVHAAFGDEILVRAEAVAPNTFDPVRLPLVHWMLRKEATPAATAALLFAYDAEASESAVRALLGAPLTQTLRNAGVLIAGDAAEHLRSALRLMPVDGLFILSDMPFSGGDAVMGPGATTAHLLRLMPSRVEGALLDLGCGAGTMALVAAHRGASRAVGTDVNVRAARMGEVNARLNGLRVEFRAGDLYAPVAGERFDTVVCQPPYVIQPPDTAGVTYLHGGPLGDAIALKAIAQVPSVLKPGGRALFLLDSPVRKGQPLHARVRDALGAAPFDLLLLTAPGPSPELQSVAYASLESRDFGSTYAAAALRYRAHLDSLGVTEFSHALVAVREASGRGKEVFTASLPVADLNALSAAQLEAVFDALDLASSPDGVLADSRVRIPSSARWREERSGPDLALEPARTLQFPKGALAASREVSEPVWALLGALHSHGTVEEGLSAYAELCGVRPDEVRAQVFGFVRQGLGTGLLVTAR